MAPHGLYLRADPGEREARAEPALKKAFADDSHAAVMTSLRPRMRLEAVIEAPIGALTGMAGTR